MAVFDRVLAALRRLQPLGFYSDDDASGVVHELRAIARALASPAERIDTLLATFLPDRADELLDRWEGLVGLVTRASDQLGARQARVVGRLRRSRGYTHSRIAAVTAPSLGLTPEQLVYLETDRAAVEAAMTDGENVGALAIPLGAMAGIARQLGRPWPGKVDFSGVRVRLVMTDASTVLLTVKLTHRDGTAWTIWAPHDQGMWGDRTFTTSVFLGKAALGPWTLSITNTDGAHSPALVQWSLLVSNDVDAAQIFHWHLQRDPALGGAADLVEAQRLVRNTAAAHYLGEVCERAAFIVDDTHSVVDRDPVG